MLELYMPLIRSVSKKFYARGLSEEDLVQEGCIGLFLACKTYEPDKGPFWHFARMCITSSILNVIVSASRKKQQIFNHSLSLDEKPYAHGEMDNRYEQIPHPGPTPEQICLNNENMRELNRWLDKHLTHLERSSLIGVAHGLSYTEIARLIGKKPKTVDNALRRAKRKLRAAAAVSEIRPIHPEAQEHG